MSKQEEQGLLGINHEWPEYSQICTPVPCPSFEDAELEIPCWSRIHLDGKYRWHAKGCKGEQDCGKPEGCYTEPVML